MSVIEIEQDHQLDYDGEVSGPMHVYWAEGHDHDPEAFLRAVIDHCIDYARDIPRIAWDEPSVEMWQRDVAHGDSVEYHREQEIPSGHRRADWRPVTVLDLERSPRGATKCSVNNCTRPWDSGQPIQITHEVDGPYLALTMWLCREHREAIPEPSYRLRFIPVGATIMLPAPEDGES